MSPLSSSGEGGRRATETAKVATALGSILGALAVSFCCMVPLVLFGLNPVSATGIAIIVAILAYGMLGRARTNGRRKEDGHEPATLGRDD